MPVLAAGLHDRVSETFVEERRDNVFVVAVEEHGRDADIASTAGMTGAVDIVVNVGGQIVVDYASVLGMWRPRAVTAVGAMMVMRPERNMARACSYPH